MPTTPIHLVKWSFPAFALILGLLWYKRRRVDRVDPGGITKNPETKAATSDISPQSTNVASKANMNLYDSGIHIDESFTTSSSNQKTTEVPMNTPRKVSASLDIPMRRSSQQILSLEPESSFNDAPEWYKEIESMPDPKGIQLGSNPQISNFEMIARSRAGNSFKAANFQDNKVMKIFEDSSEEIEQRQQQDQSVNCEKNVDTVSDECVCAENKTEETQECLNDSVKAQVQVLSERDSANHSPVSGVLEGSVTDEARSEGSTDSGKGGSINGHTKDVPISTVFEFSVPQTLVGRLIGRHGSFLQHIRSKASVNIVIKHYPTSRDLKICSIEGTTEEINIALDIIRQKFPEKKYPEVTLEQISLVKIPEEIPWMPELMQLSLIEGVNNDVVVSHIIKPNRLFVQLPTHPTYPSLRLLDANMTLLYNTVDSPPVPDQLSRGNVVVAKWYDKWVRVSIENPDPHGERHLVRLVDHGGYWVFSNAELRKIRSDYLTLPFQAIEIFLVNIQPKGGEWKEEAYNVVAHMCSGIVGQAQIVGYINSNTYVNLYLNIQKHGVISLADELVARGYAEPVPLEAIVPEDVPVF